MTDEERGLLRPLLNELVKSNTKFWFFAIPNGKMEIIDFDLDTPYEAIKEKFTIFKVSMDDIIIK